MPRKVKDRALDSRDARSKLKPRGACYWRIVDRALHIGYRRIAGKAGTWWARHYDGAGQYTVTAIGCADDVAQANGGAVLDFWQAVERARRPMVLAAPEAFTVSVAMAEYTDWLRGRGKGAADAEIKARMILPVLGSIEVVNLTTKRLRDWLAHLAETPRRLRTAKGLKQRFDKLGTDDESVRKRRANANRVWNVLRAALNHAFREGRVASDLAWRRVKPFEGADAPRIAYLTTDKSTRLLNACDPDFRALARAALETGARYSELARVTAADFNPDASTLAIGKSKTGNPRHIVLTESGAAFFEQQAAGRAGRDLLFQKANGEPWGEGQQKARMREACERARISPAIGFHGLRHSHASLLAMGGTPMQVIAKQLGHASTKVTERNYAHFAPSFARDAIRAALPKFGAERSTVARIDRRKTV